MKTWMKAAAVLFAATAALAAGKYTQQQLQARFYYDLGPDTIDVSGYPKAQQDNYKVFARTCSKCHTLARPISAPETSRYDWERFIKRMHARIKNKLGADFSDAQAKTILSFLVYDSRVRKIAGKAAFEAQTRRLKTMFADVKAARAQEQEERAQKDVRPYVDQTQAVPQPQPRGD